MKFSYLIIIIFLALAGGTQHRAFLRYQRKEMKVLNISLETGNRTHKLSRLQSHARATSGLFCHLICKKKMSFFLKLTKHKCRITTKEVDFLNPIESKSSPETVGPMKAPKANVDVHIPDTRPYVSIEFGKPLEL